ncbi:MAG TPA: nucleoid-associated protein [Cyclobacteriaceae bacterium]|nr:nucleoid-associated protein [Cyclobacteriaceae bacterium]
MIDYTDTTIEKVSVHQVGNKTNEEEPRLSKTLLNITDLKVRQLLQKFFLTPFSNPEFYNFTFSNEDFTLNPLFNFVSHVFDDVKTFQRNSVNIAKHLYELSVHPQIKSGDLFVAYFADINIDGDIMDAIGIFKSEDSQAFLKLQHDEQNYSIETDTGINPEKLDKGCLIFDIDRESGYRICTLDKSNKSIEAQFWKNSFLQLKPCSDTYHHTKEVMNITKDFVTKQLIDEFEVSKADQIDLLNRSVDYFKKHDSFDKVDFEKNVFQDKEIIKSFRHFDNAYRDENDMELSDNFEISQQAVKKQARIFKSVLKLDKNFHIYIHGKRELIEQGVEKDGRKFYKIYYEREI